MSTKICKIYIDSIKQVFEISELSSKLDRVWGPGSTAVLFGIFEDYLAEHKNESRKDEDNSDIDEIPHPPPKTKPKKKSKPADDKKKSEIGTGSGTGHELDKMTIVQLKEKCKELSIKPVGNKQSLIDKIRDRLDDNPEEGPSTGLSDAIEIVQDENNLYIHKQSGLIFDPNAKVVVAWKDQEENILPLTSEHVELCQQYGFDYRIDED